METQHDKDMIGELVTKNLRFNVHIRDLKGSNSNYFTCSKMRKIKSKQMLSYSASNEKKMMNNTHH